MRRNNKQVTTYFILFGLLLIGVVYAILQANLQINGTAKIQANTWDVHFDNIQVNEYSVAIGENDSAATIDPENNCKVDFEVTLSIPGDFYEFTIDVVNAGTIDGMIGELNKTLKVNNELVSEPPDYLDYSVTYSDGVEIEENHKISAGTMETYKVRLEFKTDIEELPQATTITTSLEPQYIQADSNATEVLHIYHLYDVFKNESDGNSGLVLEYTGVHKDSYTINGNENIYYWHPSNNDDANDVLDKWNVIFAGFCWHMYRTTDTGGIKMIYDGIPNNGICNNSSNSGIGVSAFNDYNSGKSFASVGYMYKESNITMGNYVSNNVPSDVLYGNDVQYENGYYTLINIASSYDSSHRYTCNNSIGSCEIVRFYYYNSMNVYYYIDINDGRNAEQVAEDMLFSDDVNQINSSIKNMIDTWYQNNMTNYTSKLEDTIFCNDRYVTNYGGWNHNNSASKLLFRNNAYSSISTLDCLNETDQFSMNNSKAHLTYPVGLVTRPELYLLSNSIMLKKISGYMITPMSIGEMGFIYEIVLGGFQGGAAHQTNDVRPVVSLKPGTTYRYGDGSKDNPYIIE